MMSRIQQHEQALQQAQANLEMRVDERTHELQKEVADRTRAEEKLAERTSFLNSLIENCPLAIVVIDPSRKLQMCNRAFESLFLQRQVDILGRTIKEVVGADERKEGEIAREIQHRRPIHLVTQRKRSDGSSVGVELHAVPLVADGKVTGVLAMYPEGSYKCAFATVVRSRRSRKCSGFSSTNGPRPKPTSSKRWTPASPRSWSVSRTA